MKLVTQSQSPMPKLRVTAPTVGEALIVGKRGGTMIGMAAERFWRGVRGGGEGGAAVGGLSGELAPEEKKNVHLAAG